MYRRKVFCVTLLLILLSSISFVLFADELEEGTYVVNPDGTGDFESLNEVFEIMETEGITGPVVIKLSKGSHNGPFTINKIKGSSAENTVTITSEEQGPTAVLTRSEISYADRSILIFLGTSNVIVENLTFKIGVTGDYWAINIRNKADNNIIRNCIFNPEDAQNNKHIVVVNGTSSIYTQGQPANNLYIENNSFNGGNLGVAIMGHEDTYLNNIRITYNKFTGLYKTAITASYLNAYKISGNVVEMSADGDNEGAGIMMGPSKGSFEFTGNRIFKAKKTGVSFNGHGQRNSSDRAIVANNMIGGGFTYSRDQAWTLGVNVSSAMHNVSFYYNSIFMDLPGTTYSYGSTFKLNSGSSGINIVNNSFCYIGGDNNWSYGVYIENRDSIAEMDYNNYHTNTSRFMFYGTAVTNLATLQTMDGKNQNSRVGDPKYLSQFDLHSYGAQLSGAGTPIAGITVDIDGDDRDSVAPCIGADEYIPMFDHDIAVIGLSGSNLTKVGTPEIIKVRVRNDGRIWQPQYTLYLMRDTGETLATLEVNEILWQQGDEAEHEITWVPVAKGIHKLYAVVYLKDDENHNNDRYPVAPATFNVMVQDLSELPRPQISISSNISDNSAIVSWEPIIGANSYKIYASNDPFIETWPLYSTTSNTFISIDLDNDGMLYFRVVASTAQTLLNSNDGDYIEIEVPQRDND